MSKPADDIIDLINNHFVWPLGDELTRLEKAGLYQKILDTILLISSTFTVLHEAVTTEKVTVFRPEVKALMPDAIQHELRRLITTLKASDNKDDWDKINNFIRTTLEKVAVGTEKFKADFKQTLQTLETHKAEMTACAEYLKNPDREDKRSLFPNLSQYINLYYDNEENTLLHLAVQGGAKGLIEWLLEGGAVLNRFNQAGICAFDVKDAYESETLGLQLSRICEKALHAYDKALFTHCIRLLNKTKHPQFTLNEFFAVGATNTPLPWLCQNPAYGDMLECYTSQPCSGILLYDAIVNIECKVESEKLSPELKGFLEFSKAKKVTLLELAFISSNKKAVKFLLSLSEAHILSLYHTLRFLCSEDPARQVAVFNFVVNSNAPELLTADTCEMLTYFIKKMLPPSLVKLGMLHPDRYKRGKKIPENRSLVFPYAPDDNTQVATIKRLMQRLTITYLARTYEAKDGHGREGVQCALGLLNRILAANTCEQIGIEIARLLIHEPKKTLHVDSLRTLIIRTLLIDANPEIQEFQQTVARLAVPPEPWDITLQLRVGILIRIAAQPVVEDNVTHQLIAAINNGTLNYLLQAKVDEKGLKNAADRWEALATTFGNLPQFLKALESTLKKRIGTTNDEHSHRGHLISALVNHADVCNTIGYQRDDKKSEQDNLVKTLEIYRNKLKPVVSKSSLLKDSKAKDSDDDHKPTKGVNL